MWIATALLLVLWLLAACWQIYRLQARQTRLGEELSVFTEASTRVADTLDQFMLGGRRPSAAQPSRRHLLVHAREQAEAGVSLERLAGQLHLSRDERRLLALVNRRLPSRQQPLES